MFLKQRQELILALSSAEAPCRRDCSALPLGSTLVSKILAAGGK
jgi:hypothetical protein